MDSVGDVVGVFVVALMIKAGWVVTREVWWTLLVGAPRHRGSPPEVIDLRDG